MSSGLLVFLELLLVLGLGLSLAVRELLVLRRESRRAAARRDERNG